MIYRDSFIKGYCSDCSSKRKSKCDGYCEGLMKELDYYGPKLVSDSQTKPRV